MSDALKKRVSDVLDKRSKQGEVLRNEATKECQEEIRLNRLFQRQGTIPEYSK